ncbi:Os02g0183500, partial [Oryza sativa Japonica Group]
NFDVIGGGGGGSGRRRQELAVDDDVRARRGADAAEGSSRWAEALLRRVEHQRRALLGLGRVHGGAGVRRGRDLVRRVRRLALPRRLLLLLLPRQQPRRRRLVLLHGAGRLPCPPPRLHRRRRRGVRRAVRRAGAVRREHGGDGGVRGGEVRRRGGEPEGIRELHGGGQGGRRGARVAAGQRQGEHRRRRAQDELRRRRARGAHGEQRRQDPRRLGDNVGKKLTDECWHKIPKYSSVTGVEPHGCFGCRLVFLGWILVAATLLLCGTFLLLHNVVGDTCAAMGEWVQRPQARTALDDILPCVDTAAAADALARSKDVTHHLVTVLNGVIANVSNAAAAGLPPPLYYNQSGPPVPLLCSPGERCDPGEVDLAAAPRAWRERVCRTTRAAAAAPEVCATVGRLTPAMYAQMVAAASACDALSRYGPVLADMADCAFVRRAFRVVGDEHCPGLGRHSAEVYRGLLAVAVAALASVVLWVAHSRERRRRRDAVELRAAASPYTVHHSHLEEGALLKSPRMMYR